MAKKKKGGKKIKAQASAGIADDSEKTEQTVEVESGKDPQHGAAVENDGVLVMENCANSDEAASITLIDASNDVLDGEESTPTGSDASEPVKFDGVGQELAAVSGTNEDEAAVKEQSRIDCDLAEACKEEQDLIVGVIGAATPECESAANEFDNGADEHEHVQQDDREHLDETMLDQKGPQGKTVPHSNDSDGNGSNDTNQLPKLEGCIETIGFAVDSLPNSDDTLSKHEKFIQTACQKWNDNEAEPQPDEDAHAMVEVNTTYESDKTYDTDPFGDENVKRKSSVEMEDVDLVEDETTSNPAANEAFGFLVTALREKLDATYVSDATLRQYICWKPDINRAEDRYRAHDKFLRENFNEKTLLLSVNPKVCYLLQNGMVLAPEELIDKNGCAVMVIRPAKCEFSSPHNCRDTDASRAIFFIIQQMLERKSLNTLIRGIVIILDLVGVTRKNVSAKVIKMLGNAAGCFPIRIKAIYVVAMPWWFPSGNAKKLFSPKLRERIHLLKDKSALSEYIDEDRLLEEDGGIYNFDLQSWISTTLAAEVGMNTTKS
jgi:hypothetical protein